MPSRKISQTLRLRYNQRGRKNLHLVVRKLSLYFQNKLKKLFTRGKLGNRVIKIIFGTKSKQKNVIFSNRLKNETTILGFWFQLDRKAFYNEIRKTLRGVTGNLIARTKFIRFVARDFHNFLYTPKMKFGLDQAVAEQTIEDLRHEYAGFPIQTGNYIVLPLDGLHNEVLRRGDGSQKITLVDHTDAVKKTTRSNLKTEDSQQPSEGLTVSLKKTRAPGNSKSVKRKTGKLEKVHFNGKERDFSNMRQTKIDEYFKPTIRRGESSKVVKTHS